MSSSIVFNTGEAVSKYSIPKLAQEANLEYI